MSFLKYFPLFVVLLYSELSFAQSGCTDYQATNFDPAAVTNDGSCIYPFTVLPLTFKCYIDSIYLSETSGIANQDNNFWTHVDDADNAIYRIDTLADSIFQKVTINNATNNDWEDISTDSNYIYVGDIGNNDGNRTNLRFYKVLKSDITSTTTSVNAGIIHYTYSDQVNFNVSHNYNFYECEAFFVLNDSIHLFTKGWVNRWTKHYVLSADTGTHIAQLVDSFNATGLITSAAIQGDSLVVLLGINFSGGNGCFLWMFNNFNGTQFFNGNKRKLYIGSVSTGGQAEGICLKDTNKGYITNEQFIFPAELREFDLNPYLVPPPLQPVMSTSTDSIVQDLTACSDTGSATFTIKNNTPSGGPDLHFTIAGLPPWVTASPLSDSVSSGDSALITVSFASGAMGGGVYYANVFVQSDDPFHPTHSVFCTLNVDSVPCLDFIFNSDTCTGFTNFSSAAINTPTNYYWDFGDGDTSEISNPTHPYSTNGNYNVSLIGCNASGCDTVSENVTVIFSRPRAATCYPVTQSYCCGIGITHLRIGTTGGDVINNTSSDASVGYEDFTCSNVGSMITNYPYEITCTTGMLIAEYFKVWLDMNNDGMLDSVSEELYSDLDSMAPLHSGIINIPALPTNVYGVQLRMRVASDIQQPLQPCTDPEFGQHEDYSIILNFSVGANESLSETGLKIYPNPFIESTNIEYTLKQKSLVTLEVYNLIGEKVETITELQIQSSHNHYEFRDQPAGIYFIKLIVNDNILVRRIVKTN